MFKVLIVDDEPTIREGLAALIPWEEYRISQVETAKNGEEALQLHEMLSPDLMIVDIKMPGMTGIELIERIRRKDPLVHFIILSGYAEFEYAKSAISVGVEGYLLKPILEEELMDYLARLKLKWEQAQLYQQLKDRLEDENKERMIESLLRGEIDAGIYKFFEKLRWSNYRILLITLENVIDLPSKKQLLKVYFSNGQSAIVSTYQQFLLAVFDGDSCQDDLHNELQKSVFHQSNQYTAALSEPVESLEEIAKAYQITKQLLANRFFYEQDQILTIQSKPLLTIEEKKQKEQKSLKMQVEVLFYSIELGDQQAVQKICLEMVEEWMQENPSEESIKKNFIQLISTLINKLISDYQELTDTFTNLMEKVIEIEKQSTIKQLITYIDSIFSEIIGQMDQQDSDLIVKKMIHLIERHYHTNIKLDTLAETFHYHRAYLGKLFKDYTGEYFNTYLDKIRIENSKKLLLEDLKIYQVAERVGYANVDYFHSKFKKYVGIPPSEYRKRKLIGK
ncbi:hypothetical protein ACA30_07730 [Virgibacillus soli]|uniref:response regulator transcription factor n=1 Tax=Lederbergia galactosidilytica TaxID=217031 RepID=UPI000714EE25|nr:response regulator transcription factor [Lederbergia galactosidilytica]KRG15063.1 hypothetical protein ACA30_07730 [Virgibacillus soli]MBP1913328.1 two-component system response regulator YesN [Lederbergia galactosidilytica]